jgi:hypothetical protein
MRPSCLDTWHVTHRQEDFIYPIHSYDPDRTLFATLLEGPSNGPDQRWRSSWETGCQRLRQLQRSCSFSDIFGAIAPAHAFTLLVGDVPLRPHNQFFHSIRLPTRILTQTTQN